MTNLTNLTTPALLRALTNMGHNALLRGVAPEGTLGLPVFEAIGQGILWAAHQLQNPPALAPEDLELLGDEAPRADLAGEPLWGIIPVAAELVLQEATNTSLEWWWTVANDERWDLEAFFKGGLMSLEELFSEGDFTPAEGALVVAFRLMTTPEELLVGDPVPPVQRFRDALGAVAAPAPEDKPQPQPEGVTRVDALVALGRTVLEKRENQLTPHEIHRGWALLHKANELLEKLGSPGDYLDDFLYTAAYEWIEQEATERLRELWELPKTELFNISERGYHLRELLMSFYEEAYGRPEEAIYLLREFIGR